MEKIKLSDPTYPPEEMKTQVASVVRSPEPYPYDLSLVTRKRGEGSGDVAMVLDRYERIALQTALKESLKNVEAGLLESWTKLHPDATHEPTKAELRKGFIWHAIEGFVEVQQELLRRLEEIGPKL